MRRNILFILTVSISILFAFTSCSSPGGFGGGAGGASLTINLLGTTESFGVRAATGFKGAVDSEDLDFTITLTNKDTGQVRTAVINSAETNLTVTGLSPGDYDILVEVTIFGGYPYGRGETKSFNVEAGPNNAKVTMQRLPNAIALSVPDGTSRTFNAAVGGSPPDSFSINVFNYTGDNSLDINATLTPPSAAFTLLPATLPISVGQDGSGTITVGFDTSTLAPGNYTTTLTISGNGYTVANIELSLNFYDPCPLGHDHFESLVCRRPDCNHQYTVGDPGPGGGIIFHVVPTGFTVEGYGTAGVGAGFAEYTAHYLEAAPANAANSAWGATTNDLIPATTITTFDNPDTDPLASKIGNGRKDTQVIIAFYASDAVTTTAANRASEYTTSSGHTDWFLPSYGEFMLLYNSTLPGIGTLDLYWSSSQREQDYAWTRDSTMGGPIGSGKGDSYPVRAIRAF